MIDNVIITPLKVIETTGGSVMHAMKKIDNGFDGFGEAYFSKIDFNNIKNKKINDKKIIFILGMPRSGTTLIEQIIGAHSKVYSSGELPYLTAVINEPLIRNELLGDQNKISTISDSYFSYLKNYDILENNITDKAPLYFKWIGFIKIFFPN